MERTSYFIRRLLLVVPTFIGITLLCFGITQFVPGGPVEQLVARMKSSGTGEAPTRSAMASGISEQYYKDLVKHFGFDKPFHQRYLQWLVADRIGMRMESYMFANKTAWQLIRERFPVSLILGITGFLLSYLVCIPLGIAKALRHGSRFDFATSAIVFIGYAAPPFALGMLLKMFLCGTVTSFADIFPSAGFESDHYATLPWHARIADRFSHMFLPVICYVAGHFAILTLLMKNSLLDEINKDYVRTVLAKGCTPARAVWIHALRNSLIPIATGFGSILTVMFAGSVIIERVFEIPGMGRLSLDAIVGRDYAVFMGILSLTSLLGLVGNVLSDFCYVLIDPRINFQES